MTSQLDKETIKEVIELGLLSKYEKKYPELFDYAERLAGLPKSFGAHPCGKCCCVQETVYYNATDINDDGEYILQGDMHTAEDLGLIKADFLGLRTVDVIYDTLEIIGKDYQYIAPHNLDFNDNKIWDNFKKGNTAGIFQFESGGMRDTLKKIDCSSIEDLSTANALFRPGSMKFIDNYANRKMGVEDIVYIHEDLEQVLKNSYGIIVYQEQLIEIGRLAKLSNPDKLRKATAKKNPKLLAQIQPELYSGLAARGWSQEQLDNLWETMLDFAKYSFNKSHSAAYAIIAYICMKLKVYHPREFMCAWINSVSNKIEKVAECIEEANRLGVKIYLGNLYNCSSKTVPYKDGIMIGTNSIKYCNESIADELMMLSKNKYNNFIELLDDIYDKTSINTKQLTILTGLNFFNSFGNNQYLLNIIDYYNGITVTNPETKKKQILLPPLRTCKQLKKEKIYSYDKYGLTDYLIKKYAKKQTEKQYSQIDNVGLLLELISKTQNKSMAFYDYIRFEKEYLNYITYINSNVKDYYYLVADFRTLKDVAKPYVTLRRICDGEEIKTRIKQAKIFKQNPFGEFSILEVHDFAVGYKKKPINGEWVTTDEEELILEEYKVINQTLM